MKQFISAIVVIFMLLVPVASLSENIDLSVLSDEELNILAERIDKELQSRVELDYWFNYGIGQYIPKIKLFSEEEPIIKGPLQINNDSQLIITVCNVERAEYDAYIEKLKDNGFDDVVSQSNTRYKANDKNGHQIELNYLTLNKWLEINGRIQ